MWMIHYHFVWIGNQPDQSINDYLNMVSREYFPEPDEIVHFWYYLANDEDLSFSLPEWIIAHKISDLLRESSTDHEGFRRFKILFILAYSILQFNNLVKEFVVPYILYRSIHERPYNLHVYLDLNIQVNQPVLKLRTLIQDTFNRDHNATMILPRLVRPGFENLFFIDIWLIAINGFKDKEANDLLLELMNLQWKLVLKKFTNFESIAYQIQAITLQEFENIKKRIATGNVGRFNLELSQTVSSGAQIIASLCIDPYNSLVLKGKNPQIKFFHANRQVDQTVNFAKIEIVNESKLKLFELLKTYGASRWRFQEIPSQVILSPKGTRDESMASSTSPVSIQSPPPPSHLFGRSEPSGAFKTTSPEVASPIINQASKLINEMKKFIMQIGRLMTTEKPRLKSENIPLIKMEFDRVLKSFIWLQSQNFQIINAQFKTNLLDALSQIDAGLARIEFLVDSPDRNLHEDITNYKLQASQLFDLINSSPRSN